jgi:hypothetical protein
MVLIAGGVIILLDVIIFVAGEYFNFMLVVHVVRLLLFVSIFFNF